MGADYYTAVTENGDHVDDPSEDGLFMLLEDLNQAPRHLARRVAVPETTSKIKN